MRHLSPSAPVTIVTDSNRSTTRWLSPLTQTPFATRDWTQAWQHVKTELPVATDFLDISDGEPPLTVPLYLVKSSRAWAAFEAEARVGDIWGGEGVVYGPSPYATYGLEAVSLTAIAAITEHALAWAREQGAAAVVFPGLRHPETWTEAAGGLAVRTTGSHEARVRDSVTAFQEAITSSKARREFGRQWRRGRDAGLRLRVLYGTEMLPSLEAFTKLAVDGSERHDTSLYGRDIFEAVAAVPGTLMLTAMHGKQMAGAFLCLRHRNTLYLWASGINYATLPELHTYGWLLAESVACATATGATTIDAGRGNYRITHRLGFAQVPLYAVCHLTSPDPGLTEALTGMGERIAAGSALAVAGLVTS